jgi:peptidyl-prolyl cis-trans isomerase SurA
MNDRSSNFRLRPFARPFARPVARRVTQYAALGLLLGCGISSLQAQGLRPSTSLNVPRASSDSAQRSADYIVAIVNSEPITNQEVRSKALQLEQQLSARGGAMPPRSQIMGEVLDRLINERAQLQVARDSGTRVDESSVDNAVAGVARQNQLSLEQLRQRLKEDGIDFSAFRKNIRDELLLTRVREREVQGRLQISENDLDNFIKEQKQDDSAASVGVNLSQILVAVPENASEAQISALQARAARALARAKANEDFAALVREYSDAEKSNGGQMGMRPLDRYPQLFVDAVAKLPSGALTDVLRSGAGFHILKVLERQQAGLESLTLSQTRARHILLRTGPQLSESAAMERLKKLREGIKTEADFIQVAKDNSQDGSAREGGDLGWANPGQFVPEFEEVMNRLRPGEISEPTASRYGVHVIQVVERRERKLTDREQREAAREALRERKLDEAYGVWAQEVRGRAYVEMREPPQ